MQSRQLHLTTEIQGEEENILILTQKTSRFVQLLQRKLEAYDNTVTIASHKPRELKQYVALVGINVTETFFKEMISRHDMRLIFIFFNQPKLAQTCLQYISNNKRGTIKIIHLNTAAQHFAEDIDKIFWFSFSRNKEQYLSIHHPDVRHHKPLPQAPKVQHHHHHHIPREPFKMTDLLKPRFTIPFIFGIILLVHLLFVPALALASYYHLQAAQAARSQDFDTVRSYTEKGGSMLKISRSLYSLVRPTFSLFSLAIVPDDAFILNDSANNILSNAAISYKQTQEFMQLFVDKNKSPEEVAYTYELKNTLFERATQMNQDLTVIQAKMPTWNQELKDAKLELQRITTALNLGEQFFPYFDSVFAKDSEKKYLLLFANNMELRPGGGFIGSFGVLNMKNYSIQSLNVYDVYDADGQITAHVRPPSAIRDHLNQPHWFLRDSAFSPDFYENYQQAEYFLEKSLGYRDFDGVILLTTTAIQNVLAAMGEMYVPDFKETVTADNFYIKAQLYAESEFFPGSRQKKTFLSSVMNQMMIDLPQADTLKLSEMVRKSLDEKQLVLYFDDEELQQQLDGMYWSGRTIKPKCTSPNPNCIVDYLFPYDANLGVNKANFFITKSQKLSAKIDASGLVSHTYSIVYKNDSFEDIFPGGWYKNYFQVLLPRGIRIKKVMLDDREIRTFDLQTGDFTRIGFLSEVAPKSLGKITIQYELNQPITKGSAIYQLIIQKQIGSANSDFQLALELPQNTYVVNKNFSPVVKDNKILYNTTLSADKIFYIEFFLE